MKQNNYLSYNEIHGQYESLGQTLTYMNDMRDSIKSFLTDGDIVFIACGSSYWMSLSAAVTVKSQTGRRCYAVKAGDVVLCPGDYKGMYSKPIFICPSRSGRTTEVLRALDTLRSQYPGAQVLSIVEYENSPLEAASDLTLYIPWPKEESVCQTRSFSNLYLVSLLLANIWSNSNAMFEAADRYIKNAPAFYEAHKPILAEIAVSKPASIVCLGYGRQYGVCIEGAYIVIEMAEQNSNYYQLLEYRHGPIVTAGPDTSIFILSAGGNETYEAKIAGEAMEFGAKVYSVSGNETGYGTGNLSLSGSYPGEIIALHFVFCLQSLAFHLSLANGKNPDSPGKLVPFIEI